MKISVTNRIMATLLLAITGIISAKAQSISVTPLEILPGEQKTVEVAMSNDMAVSTLQFDVLLPEGLTMIGDFEKTSRIPSKIDLSSNLALFGNPQSKRLATVPQDLTATMAPGEGAVIRFTVKADENLYTSTDAPCIKFSRISYTIKTTTETKQPDFTVTVMKTKPVVKISGTPDRIVMAPGQMREVTFALTNSVNCSMLEFMLHLPPGVTLPDDDWYTLGSRVNPTAMLLKRGTEGNVKVVLAHNPTSTTLESMTGNEGDFLTLKLHATDALAATSGITVSNVVMSTTNGTGIDGTSTVNVTVVSSTEAKNNADAQIAALQNALNDAVNTINTNCPDVKDQFPTDGVQQMINDLKDAVDTAYEDGTLVDNYNNILSPTAGIQNAIDQLVNDAEAAQTAFEKETQRKEQNKAAYDADMAKIQQLKNNLQTTIAEINKTYPGCDDQQADKAVEDAINAAEQAVKDAYAAVANEGTYTSPLNADELQAQIDALLAKAELQAKENARQAANKAAYDADLAKIQELKNNLQATIAQIETTYPGYNDQQANKAVEDAINAAKDAIDAAYAAVANEGTYTSPLNVEELKAQIDALLTNAEVKAENARQAANKAAYDADLAKIQKLKDNLQATIAQIEKSFPGCGDAQANKAVEDAINAAKDAADAAFAAVANEGTYTSPLNNVEELQAQIDALLTNAGLKADENARQAANKAAYDADLAKIQELKNNLQATIAKIQETYPGCDDQQANKAVEDAINAAKNAADAAFAAVANEGVYKSSLNAEELQDQIDALLANAKIKADENARKAANKTAYDADLAKIQELKNNLQATIAQINETYPGCDDPNANKAVENAINAAKAAVDAAYAAVATEGVYSSPLNAEELQAQIDALLANAKIKADENARKAANKAAYDADLEKIVELRTLLNNVWANTCKDYPEFADIVKKTDAENAILAAEQAIKKAYDAVAEEGIYESPLNYDEIKAQIEAIYTNAAEKAEAARKEANKEAYENDLAKVDELQQALDNAKKETEGKPGFDADVQAIQDKIDALRDEVENEYDDVEEEGNYESPIDDTDVDNILNDIENIIKAAGIDGIYIDPAEGDVMIFTLDGKRHAKPVRGEVNIIHTSTGKTYKIMVK